GATTGDVVVLLVWLTPADTLLEQPGLGRDVRLAADDRLHAGGGRLLVEVVRPVHVAVVRDRDGGHLLAADLGEHVLEPGGAVEHRVLGVDMQVHEGVGHGVPSRAPGARWSKRSGPGRWPGAVGRSGRT